MKASIDLARVRQVGFEHAIRVLAFRLGLSLDDVRHQLKAVSVPVGSISPVPTGVLATETEDLPVFQKPRTVEGDTIVHDAGSGASVVASTGDTLVFGYDVWLEIGSILCGSRDSIWGTPIDSSMSPSIPVADKHIQMLLDWLSTTRNLERLDAPWPHSRSFALGLSHDIDRIRKTFQHVSYPIRHLRQGRLRAALRSAIPSARAYWRIPEIRELESQRQVRSTFFALPGESDARSPRVRDRILLWGSSRFDSQDLISELKGLRAGGWEVGLHNSVTSRTEASVLRLEKQKLEAILNSPVLAVRQHFLAPEVSQLWLPQARSGFVYDSSMGFADRLGFRAGTCFPYETIAEGLWELPFEIMDGALPRDGTDAWAECLGLLNVARNLQGALVVLWHQRYFDPVDFAGFRELYCGLIDEASNLGAWIAPCGEIVDEWRRRSS